MYFDLMKDPPLEFMYFDPLKGTHHCGPCSYMYMYQPPLVDSRCQLHGTLMYPTHLLWLTPCPVLSPHSPVMAYPPLSFDPRCGETVRVTEGGMKVEKTILLYVPLSVCGVCVKVCECAGSTFSSKWGYHNHSLKLLQQLYHLAFSLES